MLVTQCLLGNKSKNMQVRFDGARCGMIAVDDKTID